MQKLIIKSSETGATLLASVSSHNEENLMLYACSWIKEKGYTPDSVIIDIVTLDSHNGKSYKTATNI